MTPCLTQEDLFELVDRSLSVERGERLTEHVAQCAQCRARHDELQALVDDLKASVPAGPDLEAHCRAVMDRIGREPDASRPRRWLGGRLQPRPWQGAVATALLAAGALLAVRTSPRAGWQARGGPVQPTLARDVRVKPCAMPGLRPLASGEAIDATTALTATFRNIGKSTAYLLLFAVDSRGVVHWITPAYSRADEDPAATTLAPAASDSYAPERVLGTTVVLDDVAPGPLRIIAVILAAPARVSEIESMGAGELDRERLSRKFPQGTDIRETTVDVVHAADRGGR